MKIKRAALIAAITKAQDDHKAATEQWEKLVAKWRSGLRAEWNANDLPKWKALRDMLSDAIRNRQPITYGMVKEAVGKVDDGYYSDPLSGIGWTDPDQLSVPGTIDGVHRPGDLPFELDSLKATLEAIADDEVSDHQLRSLGFTDLKRVFRAATINGGAA